MSIINYIEKYRKMNRTLFTTPSHSQGEFISPDSIRLLGKKFFQCDYSELEGFDNLSDPKGIIRETLDNAAKIYEAKSTFFLTNGSTSGIIAAMFAILNKGDKVLIARNCHKSVYNALVLTGAVPVWIMPEYNPEWGIFESINYNNLAQILDNNKDIKALFITNPSYEGAMTDINRISYICKRYKIKLIVDEAHGALWNFHRALGIPAITMGADITVQSLHKTAGALNPCALLHIGKNSTVNPDDIQNALNLISTTSPSYPLLVNMESSIYYLFSNKGKSKIIELVKNINRFIRSMKNTANVQVYSQNNDITKILLKVVNMSGFELSNILFDKYGIEDELANEKSVLFLTGLGTTKNKLKKLEKAIIEICKNNIRLFSDDDKNNSFVPIEPTVRYSPSQVWNKESQQIKLKDSLSRVCMEVIADYPPGIPLLMPGEVIKQEHIDYLSSSRENIKVLA